MEREDEIQRIKDVLSGNDTSFNDLVEKYSHARVAKDRCFHFAEEITQGTFVKAYNYLSTFKDPSQFAGWLYTIANRLSYDWIQQEKLRMQSLEDLSVPEIEQASYTYYVSREATEYRYQRVKELLEKLPKNEQQVVTLYYLGEMTTKEIGESLGVSVNTIS